MGVEKKSTPRNLDQFEIKFYEIARNEILERIKLRDHALIAYIVSIGSYITFVYEKIVSSNQRLFFTETISVLIIPIICITFSYITVQHHTIISALAKYINNLMREKPFHWNAVSYTFGSSKGMSSYLFKHRLAVQAMILSAPLLLTINYAVHWREKYPYEVLSIAIVEILSGLLIVKFHIDAQSLRDRSLKIKHP